MLKIFYFCTDVIPLKSFTTLYVLPEEPGKRVIFSNLKPIIFSPERK